MKYTKILTCGVGAALMLSLSACSAGEQTAPSEAPPTTLEQTQATAIQTEATLPASQFWDDVVELVNPQGDSTTAYKLEDGRYLDRLDRFFTYDGAETWTCNDGSLWNRKADSAGVTTTVSAEFAIERFLAQRPDHLFFSDGAGDSAASKIVLTFDTTVTNFRFLKLEGTIGQSGEFRCSNMESLYSRDVITENDLMVVETVLEGLVPSRGISFVDAGGNTRYYYLALSGEDNVPLLISFN